jgi:GPH family glycoside/pentoside/hexuronide:cation symporter
MAGFSLMAIPFSIWLMKFSTDVLLIAPAAFGTLMMVGRIWDAITDPIVGYLSDRTNVRRGRRRSWMLASAIPLFVTIVALWSPPWMLEGTALVLWMGAALLLYETASTTFLVPIGALGMELTEDYQERTRLFGYRHVVAALGSIFGLGAVYLLRTAEEPRVAALVIAALGGALLSASIIYAATRLPEREDYRGRGSSNLVKAFTDVLRNPHGRLLFLVYGVETFGAASIGLLAPYVMQYVVREPDLNEVFILVYFVPQFALTPLWIRLGKVYSKKSLWVFAMIALTLGYTSMFFIREGSFELLFMVIFLLGLGGGCGAVIAPSIQADVVDYDEYLTGERKEGAYTAIWNFIRKAAGGLTAGITGYALQAAGYVPNADDQTEAVKVVIMALMGLLPATCYAFGTLMFLRFSLNREEHERIVKVLRERGGGPPIKVG